MRQELPVLFTRDICADPARLAKALQQTFDLLSGEAYNVNERVGQAFDYADNRANEAVDEAVEATPVDQKLNEAGVGSPDGQAPTEAPTNIILTSGINYDIWLLWNAIRNNSAVSYAVERATAAAGPFTEVGITTRVPGDPGGSWQFHDTGLALNTDYYYRVRAVDADGYGPYSAVAGPKQVNKTVGEQIADATIDLGTKVAGLLGNANLAQITDPAKLASAIVTHAKLASGAVYGSVIAGEAIAANHLAAGAVVAGKIAADAITSGNIQAGAIQTGHMTANTIQGDRIAAGTLSAEKIVAGSITATEIAANAITADKLDANAVTAKNIKTAAEGARVEILGADATERNKVLFKNADGYTVGRLYSSTTSGNVGFYIDNPQGSTIYMGAEVIAQSGITISGGKLVINTANSVVGMVPGQAVIYKDGNTIKAKASDGTQLTWA